MSPRLQAILDRARPGLAFWDVACDHGLLGEAAWRSERFPLVHFVDPVPHIMAALRMRFEDQDGMSFHLCRGEDLDELSGTVSVAGVGGHTIVRMLESWRARSLRPDRLILNPVTRERELRHYLKIRDDLREVESLVIHERDRAREIIILE